MSYEEIDRSVHGTDVFTNGAEGRYSKAKPTSINGEKKKRIPKVTPSSTDMPNEQSYENGHTDEVVKTKKKSRKTHENGEIQNEDETTQVVSSADGETVIKPKKKRTPKIESNNENIDPIPPITTEEPIKKKKSKAPKSIPIEEDFQLIDNSTINELEPSTEITPKVKKSKKHKTPKTTTDTFDDMQINNSNEYTTNSEFNGGVYDSTVGNISYDIPPSYPIEAEQIVIEPEKSEYEIAITNAYNNLASKINFSQFVGDDQWCIIHLPKGARSEPKSRIRKMLPGRKDDKSDGQLLTGKSTINQKGGFFNRIRSGVSTLVNDENNLIFGERSNYDVVYYDEEEEDDGIDTDDLHRYAQKLRELEDTDREVNPEFLVLRDGKTVYGVHEAGADGKMTLSTRKPIYDRFSDQAPDDTELTGRKKLFSRLKNSFTRNKDKDGKGSNSPNLSNGTPDASRKRSTRKTTNKTGDDDMATVEPLVD